MTIDDDAAESFMRVARRLLRVAQILWAVAVLGVAGPLVWGLAGASFSSFGFGVLFFSPILLLTVGFIAYGQSLRHQNKAVFAEASPSENA